MHILGLCAKILVFLQPKQRVVLSCPGMLRNLSMSLTHYRDFGSRPGSGGVASSSLSNADRRERLRLLALETIDLAKDPYFMKNHLGSYECRLCLTLHNNEGSYLAHTQGRRHQQNLARRAAKESGQIVNPMPIVP